MEWSTNAASRGSGTSSGTGATSQPAAELDVLVVGLGSNLLVADDGFDGVVVVLGDGLADVEIDGTRVRAGGRATGSIGSTRRARTLSTQCVHNRLELRRVAGLRPLCGTSTSTERPPRGSTPS